MRRKNRRRIAALAALLVAAALFAGCKGKTEEEQKAQSYIEQASFEACYSAYWNPTPSYNVRSGQADLQLQNLSEEGQADMQVTLTLPDGEELYRSEKLKAGESVETVKLSCALETGSYELELCAIFYNSRTGEEIGRAEDKVQLTVTA